MTWQRTGVKYVDLAEGAVRGAVVGTTAVVLVRAAGAVRAFQGACPHLGGDLADGAVEAGKLVCPLHGATFDLETGAVRADPFGVSPPEGGVEPLAVYPTRVTDGEVEVDL